MRRILPILLSLPLAACHSGPSGPGVSAANASESEVEAKVATVAGNGDLVRPGRWEGMMKMAGNLASGLSPEQAKALADKLSGDQPFVSCIKPEDVKTSKAFFNGDADEDKSCKYDHFTMAGGKVDAVMSCDEGRTKMTTTTKGTYAPESYTMTVTTNSGGQPGMTMSVAAKRVGECRGTPDEK